MLNREIEKNKEKTQYPNFKKRIESIISQIKELKARYPKSKKKRCPKSGKKTFSIRETC